MTPNTPSVLHTLAWDSPLLPPPDVAHTDDCGGCRFERLHKAARDLYDDAGVRDIDPRLDYLEVQVTREVWNDFVAVIDP